ncbi:MAG: hypothetical protein ACRECU_09190 [Methylocella sp.]
MTILCRKGFVAAFALLGLAAGSNEAFGEWSATVFTNQKGVHVHGKAVNSRVIFHITCNTESTPELSVSFGPYRGNALDNIDDVSRSVVFVVKNHDGAAQKFPATMHYYGPDNEWVLNPSSLLPPAFIDEFGRGDVLTIRNGRGNKVVDFDLNGAGKTREAVHRVCHM